MKPIVASQQRELYDRAYAAGVQAANACIPTPMIVQEHANPLDDNSPVVRTYAPVMDGVCGFAWVNVRPGNCTFARWLVETGHGRRDTYAGGVNIWISAYNQSYERKRAHAVAMAAMLQEANVTAYVYSRLD